MKVLFLSNLSVDLGDPFFRKSSYEDLMLPMAGALASQCGTDVRVLATPLVSASITPRLGEYGLVDTTLCTFDATSLSDPSWQDFMVRSYLEDIPSEVAKELRAVLDDSLGGWVPDAVICWEAPSGFFRNAFPDALVVDLMPGIFMRPPYPALLSFDPKGLYKDCWHSGAEPGSFTAADGMLDGLNMLRQYYRRHFEALDIPAKLKAATGISLDPGTRLVPLQIGDYFGWSHNTGYESQADFLEAVLQKTPPEIPVLPTQYIARHIEDRVIHEGNLDALRERFANLRYDPALEKLDNITQYLVPFAGPTVTVSSSLGLQAAFFGKTLISPSISHLSSFADATDLAPVTERATTDRDPLLANYLFRGSAMRDRLKVDGPYLKRLLDAMIERRSENGQEVLPSAEDVACDAPLIVGASNSRASRARFNDAFGFSSGPTLFDTLCAKIDARQIDTVSFDVFDTLLCRTVLEPDRVFDLVAEKLRSSGTRDLPDELLRRFAQVRQGTERKLRAKLDRTVGQGAELSIKDVYRDIVDVFQLDPDMADTLVAAEQEAEHACLRARHDVVALFHRAKAKGKRVFIISDFIHPTEFVAEALRRNGIADWDGIYVSSDIGAKKHDGSLYEHVRAETGAVAETWVHVGDNPHGDIEMAKAKAITPLFVPALPRVAMGLAKDRRQSLPALRESLFLGSVLAGFARDRLDIARLDAKGSQNAGLISDAKGLGFLTLGPLMYFFTRHLLARARREGLKQIVFFARDCWLPFKMAQRLVSEADDISVLYWPVSRASVSGLDIHTHNDLMKVRIDDFRKSSPLAEIFERRFHLLSEEVDTLALADWSDRPIDQLKVGDVPEFAIYEIAIASAAKSGASYYQRLQDRRDVFKSAARQWGTYFDKPTMTVDIGYKGSIHNKVAGFFAEAPVAQMLVSYPSRTGGDPVKGLDAYYLRNQLPQLADQDPLVKYNLIFETLVNEGCGSVLDYARNDDGSVRPLRAESMDDAHQQVISDTHEGALQFAKTWQEDHAFVDEWIDVSLRQLPFFLEQVLAAPTAAEANLIGDLVFDNSFAGNTPRHFIERGANGRPLNGSLWSEGAAAVSTPSRRARGGYGASDGGVSGAVASSVIGFFIRRLGSERLYQKFRRDPVAFFADSRNPKVRRVGEMLF